MQVVGKKWIWIAPPSVSDVMDAFGAAAAAASNEDEEMAGATALMSNTTRLDLTLSPSDPSLANAVEYQNTVVPLSQQAVLEPGDMLFMPPGYVEYPFAVLATLTAQVVARDEGARCILLRERVVLIGELARLQPIAAILSLSPILPRPHRPLSSPKDASARN